MENLSSFSISKLWKLSNSGKNFAFGQNLPLQFCPKIQDILGFSIPKVGVPLESLKNASFSFSQCVDAFFLLLGCWQFISFLFSPNFGYEFKAKVVTTHLPTTLPLFTPTILAY